MQRDTDIGRIILDGKLQRFRLAVHDAVKGHHGAARRVIHCAHIADDLVRGEELGAYDAVDPLVFVDVVVFRAVDLRDGFRHADKVREHGDDQVLFVHAGERDDGVHLADALFDQKLLHRAVAVHDGRLRQAFGKLQAALFFLFDDGELHLAADEPLREVLRRAAPADDHHMLRFGRVDAEVLYEADKVACVGRDGELVAYLQRKAALRDGNCAAAVHRADEGVHVRKHAELIKARVCKHVVFLDLQFHQLHAALCEGIALEEGGVLQQAEDFKRSRLFGVDDHGKAELILQKARLLVIFRVAHARDGVAAAELARHHAAEEVGLVAGGGGNEQVA